MGLCTREIPTLEVHGPRVGSDEPGDDVKKGRLARAVWTDEGMDRSFIDGEVDPIESEDSAEPASQSADRQHGLSDRE
jgi:hypothetical protein